MTLYSVGVHAEIPNAVLAKQRLLENRSTTALVLESAGGSERSIAVPVEAADKAAANAAAIQLVREVLGDVVTGELWVEETSEA